MNITKTLSDAFCPDDSVATDLQKLSFLKHIANQNDAKEIICALLERHGALGKIVDLILAGARKLATGAASTGQEGADWT